MLNSFISNTLVQGTKEPSSHPTQYELVPNALDNVALNDCDRMVTLPWEKEKGFTPLNFPNTQTEPQIARRSNMTQLAGRGS